jgi:hypothetical protein
LSLAVALHTFGAYAKRPTANCFASKTKVHIDVRNDDVGLRTAKVANRTRRMVKNWLGATKRASVLSPIRVEMAEIRQPLGYGVRHRRRLLLSQLLTLFTTPVVYIYMDNLRQYLSRESRTAAGDADSALGTRRRIEVSLS